MSIHTPRLDLVTGDLASLDAAWAGHRELAEHLRVTLPIGWPPDEFDRDALGWVRDHLLAGEDPAWWLHWVVLREPAPTLVGIAGYKGAPTPEGTVEIGYSVVTEFRRRRIAAEAAAGLVAGAFTHPAVERVLAETLHDHRASIGVLTKNGFLPAGEGSEPGLSLFERRRTGADLAASDKEDRS